MRYRSNPNYELIALDNLSSKEQTELTGLKKDPHFYRILRPNKAGLTMKAIGADTANLFLKLRLPFRLDNYVDMTSKTTNKNIIQLVMNGVLEIESEKGFVSGIEAYSIFYKDRYRSLIKNNGNLTSLSIKALRYAQNLRLSDAIELSMRLYFYNRIPASKGCKNELSSKGKIASYLGIGVEGPSHPVVDRLMKITEFDSNQDWFYWRTLDPFSKESEISHKLYISPHPTDVKKAFMGTVRLLVKNKFSAFKVGASKYGILRPDKMIVYFSSFSDLKSFSDQLHVLLEGIRAQGVPFTAILDYKGLLSWGMDPPAYMKLLPWDGPSWRRWLTNRLASSLIQASNTNCQLEPWEFALKCIKLDGVNPITWIPDTNLWKHDV